MFYITTAIDYTNGAPHIGHAYEKVLADVIARWQRMRGEEVYFLTGVDQHGQKVQQKAAEVGLSPQEYADASTQKFIALWDMLDISYDGWAATTDEAHKACVAKILTNLKDKGLLYKKGYKGFYSVRQEQFLTDKERGEDGNFGPEWGEVVELEEENWYFKLSEQAEWLKNFIEKSSDTITPSFRKQELLSAIERSFGSDLCISRPKDRLSWGIPLPFDEEFVTYVWFDALINYISFAGYLAEEDSELPDFNKLWPAACEVIGKDILVPAHGVYWYAMLHAMGFSDEQMPKLLVHGWLNINGEKMSKSVGNIVNPVEVCELWGAEPLRYYLVRDVRVGYDSDYDIDRLKMIYNTELANDLGNLLNRSLNMCQRYCAGKLSIGEGDDELSAKLRESLATQTQKFISGMDSYQINEALGALIAHVTHCNGYIEQTQPWALAKDEAALPQLQRVLHHLLESCAHVGYLIACVLPEASRRILEQLQLDLGDKTALDLHWGLLPDGHEVQAPSPVFPRILSAEEKAKMAEKAAKAAAKAARKAAQQ